MSSEAYSIIINKAIDTKEKGYVNNPKDSGGETNWGITIGLARAYGYEGSMKLLSRATAITIYEKEFWKRFYGDEIVSVSFVLAEKLFDVAINLGTNKAVSFLQQSLNVFNRQGSMYPDIEVDGIMGPKTLSNVKDLIRIRGSNGALVLYRAINAQQGVHYISLVQQREKDEEFITGWFLNRVI